MGILPAGDHTWWWYSVLTTTASLWCYYRETLTIAENKMFLKKKKTVSYETELIQSTFFLKNGI